MTWFKALGFSAVAFAALSVAQHASADALLTVEASAGKAISAPQSDRFGFGGALAIAAYGRVAPWLLLGGSLRAGALTDADAPENAALVDPGIGTFEMLSGMVRLRPFASTDQPRSALGLFLEGGGGATVTGSILRPGVEAAIGYGFGVGDSFALSPVVRYLQVVQVSDPLSDEDARLLLFGVQLALVDSHPAQAAHESPPQIVAATTPPVDSDHDGVADADDTCRTEPEDKDGFQDGDGCPERDNDQDKIADADDKCPMEAEDADGFEDEDGCPDPDNDRDGFADADDKCPLDAEVVNGNQDYDGCPDQGLIEMHDDRIVLDEEVLFDSGFARVKTAARPVLNAIVKLCKQHPEWLKIRIEGHADQTGNEDFNQALSEHRANNVLKRLVKLGIPATMIEAAGYGSTRPRGTRDSDQRNRRVEFVVVARAKTDAAAPPHGGAR